MSARKKILIAMAIFSGLILLYGGIFSMQLYHEMMTDVTNIKNMDIDGTDFSSFFQLFGFLGATIIALMPITSSIIIVALQWVVYGIVRLIKHKSKK